MLLFGLGLTERIAHTQNPLFPFLIINGRILKNYKMVKDEEKSYVNLYLSEHARFKSNTNCYKIIFLHIAAFVWNSHGEIYFLRCCS